LTDVTRVSIYKMYPDSSVLLTTHRLFPLTPRPLLVINMHSRSVALVLFALLSAVASLPAPPAESLDRRVSVTLPGSNSSIIDTGDDLSGLSDLDPIPDGFLEGDSDTGGGSKTIG
jgi:hypothetical protein